MSRVVEGLRPPALDEGLANALRELCTRFDGPVTITLETDLSDRLPAAVEVCLYRIAAEALSNVVRHAHATRCALRLDRADDGSDEGVALSVVDDGRGPGGRSDAGGTGVGLQSMRLRAEELGGRCVVAAGEHGGTRVDAWVPARLTPPPAGAAEH